MRLKIYCVLAYLSFSVFCVYARIGDNVISNSCLEIFWKKEDVSFINYKIKKSGEVFKIQLPEFEINNIKSATLKNLTPLAAPVKLKNNVLQYTYSGTYLNNPSLSIIICFEISPDNPVVRFKYILKAPQRVCLTKLNKKDNINYLSFITGSRSIKEIRLSEFNSRFHASDLNEYTYDSRNFVNETAFMGPIAVVNNANNSFLVAYEHGSQYPDSFLQFQLRKNGNTELRAVKGNYLSGQAANDFTSVWFEVAGVNGNDDLLAANYRDFLLKYITQNTESRKPYIFYNTWGRQERSHWAGEQYLSTMRLDYTLNEIDRAHDMGIEVYVLDAGWFEKTGDWEVDKKKFPDEMKQVKAKLDGYGMKLGLWFNPTVAAVTSNMYKNNLNNRMSRNGKYYKPVPIWESPESGNMCLVSSYWEDYANELIRLSKEIGVTYFKWDAISQYGCNDPHHFHGNETNSEEERTQSYAYLQPLYMSKIVDKVCAVNPNAIFDFDITEAGRCMGLQFLSSGKYFIMNNGPYFHNYDLNRPANNNNIFVSPGPARGWITRSVLTYDKWIPSVLFLTHYFADDPLSSQQINLASLILGQNGIWGDILKTSKEGTAYINNVLNKYKKIRAEITKASIIATGKTGGNPEIYEKIDPETGKGCIVFFGDTDSELTYISHHKVVDENWHTEDMTITKDDFGRAIIHYHFKGPSARMVLFGTK